MRALIFDKSKYDWETSKGFDLADVPKPELPLTPSLISARGARLPVGQGSSLGGKEGSKRGVLGDVLIKVHYAGVCGTDKGIWYRQAMRDLILGSIDSDVIARSGSDEAIPSKARLPHSSAAADSLAMTDKYYRILGHEFFGEIVEVGKAAAKEYKLKKGDFVSCESHVVCNQCFQCLRGEKHVCTEEKILGISQDGGFAEYVKVPGHIVWKTDTAKIRPEIAAMQEPFGNAVHAASKVDLKAKTIAIFGLGPIGLFLLLVAKGLGVKEIIGVEPNPVAQEMAKKLGIDYVIQNSPPTPSLIKEGERGSSYRHDEAVISEIMKITNGLGVDVSFEMAGFNSSLNNAIFATRRGGDVILFGLKTGDFVLQDYNRLIVRGLTLHAVIGRQIWQTWETTRKLMEDPSNGIQEKIFNIILNRGEGTILPIAEYSKEKFERMMSEHPKFLIQF